MDDFDDIFDLETGQECPMGNSITVQDTINGSSLIYDDQFKLVGDVKPWLNGEKITFYGSSLDFEDLSCVKEGIFEQFHGDDKGLSLPNELGLSQDESEILFESKLESYQPDISSIERDEVIPNHETDFDSFTSDSPKDFLFFNPELQDLSPTMDVPNFDSNVPVDLVAGDPAEDMQNWEYQGYTNRCALYSQKFIIESLTGHEVPIEDIVAIAEDNGWYDENSGTMPQHLDKILNYYDIDTVDNSDATLSDIEESLNNGVKVMVPVDIDELYDPNHDSSIFAPNDPNHMVQVIGIDKSNPDQSMVVLNDSGHPDGRGALIPSRQFDNAWKDSGRRMITAC